MSTQKALQPLVNRNHVVVTTDTTLERAQCGDSLIMNTGATGTVICTLPVMADKLKCRFLRTAAYTLTIDPNGTDIITGSDGVSLGAGVAKSLTTAGAYCEIECDGTSWYVTIEAPAAAAALADGSVTAAKIGTGAVTNTKLGAGAVTATKLAATGVTAGSFVGKNGSGAITLAGAVVGQRVFAIFEIDTNSAAVGDGASFETTITVTDQIQQSSASNLSAKKYGVILVAAAA